MPPHGPPRTPKQVSWPHRLLRSPRLHYKSSEDPSSVAVDPMKHLLPLPLDPLGPCRPTPLAPVAVNRNQGSTRGRFYF